MKLFFTAIFLITGLLAKGPIEFSKEQREKLANKDIPSITSCIEDAENHGRTESVNEKCFDQLLLQSTYATRTSQQQNQLLAVGHKNILFIESKIKKMIIKGDHKRQAVFLMPRTYVISGSQTSINEIISISFNPNSQTIAVLNKNTHDQKEILIFPTYRSGNISPLRVINLKTLSPAAIRIDHHPLREELFVLDQQTQNIIVISAKADSRHHQQAHHPQKIRELILDKDIIKRPVDMTIHQTKLILADKSSNSIYLLDLECSGKCAILGETTSDIFNACDLISVEHLPKDKEIVLTNECDQQTSFELE